jgi:hypothetical protein
MIIKIKKKWNSILSGGEVSTRMRLNERKNIEIVPKNVFSFFSGKIELNRTSKTNIRIEFQVDQQITIESIFEMNGHFMIKSFSLSTLA